jgi:hypothetical protein
VKVSVAVIRYVTERAQRGELTGASPVSYRTTLMAFARAGATPEVAKLSR